MKVNVVNDKSKGRWPVVAQRLSPERKTQLRLIQQELGHGHLSETLNLAVDRLVEQYLRGDVKAA